MNILFTTESYYPIIDGGAVAQHRIVHELKRRGHEMRVIAPGFSFSNTTEDDQGTTIYRPRAVTLPFYMNNKYHVAPFPFFYVKHIIDEFKPDVINVCSPYPNSLCAMIIAKKQGIPIVGSIHILPENILAPLLDTAWYNTMVNYTWRYLVWFYNRVDWATVPTQTGAAMYTERGLRVPITAISNGVDTVLFNPKNHGGFLRERLVLPEKPLVLYCGRMNQEKNVDVLIRAIPQVLSQVDAHFLFCGSGGLKPDLMKLAETLGVSDHTTFIEFLDWADYPNVYALADLFVMPGESELQSIVTLEAIASGVPAIVVNKGAVPELVNNGNGLVFEPKDSGQLAANIISVLSDKKRKDAMRKRCLQLVKRHSMSSVGALYEQVYDSVLEKHNF
ncbi:MAG TPA: glycosyltransferase [Candidatus Thermoplasmatota archaeon]|nr:glycosyltransferase [Candidatus Thermoplasmatota archaeon]